LEHWAAASDVWGFIWEDIFVERFADYVHSFQDNARTAR
jgi:hypothetical protein